MRILLTIIFFIIALASNAQESVTVPVKDSNLIYHIVQESPRFHGGTDSLISHIKREMVYPEEALANGEEGMIFIQFVVNKDGCVDSTDLMILRGVSELLDAEAIRIVKSFPCWIPGKQNGSPVRVYYKLPIRFRLDQ